MSYNISYVTELELIDHGETIHFVIPTTIVPRDNPSQGAISSTTGTNSKYPRHGMLKQHPIQLNVRSVSSTAYLCQIEFNQDDVCSVKFTQTNTHLGRNIRFDIQLSDQRSTTIIACQSQIFISASTKVGTC
ncbi:unnamed protein product [Adineta ricciae]|uniref:Uncharacterized protein n=1 Tax=Adineta ricciae TaxID=249248 RepID=A0A814Z7W6_ADIRI|nr:unnamed protein product [Adineta ricciae]CAF1447230.1 unnamed protein product [Adineta ricciae]